MQNFRFQYLIGLVLLAGAYLFFVQTDGYRLPFYYAPDGEVLPFGTPKAEHPAKIKLIAGSVPTAALAVFPDSNPVELKTDQGTREYTPVPNRVWHVLYDFKYFIFYSIVFLLCGFWFLDSANDVHLAAFSFLVMLYCFTTVICTAYHELQLFHQLTLVMLLASLFNLGLRTTGKEVPGNLLLAEVTVFVFLALIAYVGQNNLKTISNLKLMGNFLFFGAVIVTLTMLLENAIRGTDDPIEKRKRWVLFVGIFMGLFLPVVLYKARELWAPDTEPYTWLFPASILFPISLLYGTYRIQLVPFQFVLTHSILAGLLTVVFAIVYGLVLLVHNLLLSESAGTRWIVHIIFIISLVFFLDPARRRLAGILQRRVFRMDANLTESLESLAKLISSPLHLQSVIQSFITQIRDTLDVEKVDLLFSNSSFPGLQLKSGPIPRMSDKSSIWRYLKPEKMIVTSYLTYGGGTRGELYRYLFRNSYYLGIGISGPAARFPLAGVNVELENLLQGGFRRGDRRSDADRKDANDDGKVQAAMLVGYKKDHHIFSLAEIRYLHEAARLAGMLMYNYSLLLQEVEKRRRMRELFLAGQAQRSISSVTDSEVQGLRISYFNLPVISVSGDYLDVIPLSARSLAFLLGDVSGHGLGTGYLVSTFRSLIRSHLQSGATLTETVDTLNQFLLDRYRGSEFITLFAFILNTSTGHIEFLNAAHPSPYIMNSNSGEIRRLSDSQRLLGVLPRAYTSRTAVLQPGDRIFLYSDGVTETFNSSDVAFGDPLLMQYLRENGSLPLEEITEGLRKALNVFRETDHLTDDTTFVALEYSPGFSIRNIFSFLGFDQRAETEQSE